MEPSWRILDQFVVDELENVLKLDALVMSHPISVEVSDPNEINEIFDSISYSKGELTIDTRYHTSYVVVICEIFHSRSFDYTNDGSFSNSRRVQTRSDKLLDKKVRFPFVYYFNNPLQLRFHK